MKGVCVPGGTYDVFKDARILHVPYVRRPGVMEAMPLVPSDMHLRLGYIEVKGHVRRVRKTLQSFSGNL